MQCVSCESHRGQLPLCFRSLWELALRPRSSVLCTAFCSTLRLLVLKKQVVNGRGSAKFLLLGTGYEQ
jgi:hypothetical protein